MLHPQHLLTMLHRQLHLPYVHLTQELLLLVSYAPIVNLLSMRLSLRLSLRYLRLSLFSLRLSVRLSLFSLLLNVLLVATDTHLEGVFEIDIFSVLPVVTTFDNID
ncbi:MAG: hypothetical protein EBS30_16785 [Planctomycetes bacterium]|nr:hypothetical protein [Planctomycetota bacterium]